MEAKILQYDNYWPMSIETAKISLAGLKPLLGCRRLIGAIVHLHRSHRMRTHELVLGPLAWFTSDEYEEDHVCDHLKRELVSGVSVSDEILGSLQRVPNFDRSSESLTITAATTRNTHFHSSWMLCGVSECTRKGTTNIVIVIPNEMLPVTK
ncbi:hypothetical protein Y032_0315g2264 [Ancylostoma ceylanicum]|uniref:Uncharacterized protein n=1 Tax=Ancylostoma ceylanicum TaxID=53326 RepID=A0A016S2E6_9BILA|nr:hypothetical protein Y032_0315g2264 [Ancylostoma ceylanicum]